MRTTPIKPQVLPMATGADASGRPLTPFDSPARRRRGWPRRAARLWLLAVGVMFAATALDKLMHLPAMVSAVAAYNLMPDALAGVAAAVVITAEIVGSLLLLIPRWQPRGAIVAIVLLGLFAAVIAASVVNRMDIDCGCSNLLAPAMKVSWLLAGRNLALALVCLIAWDQLRTAGTDGRGRSQFVQLRLSHWTAAAAVAVAFAAAVFLTARWQAVNTEVLNASRGSTVASMLSQTAAAPAETAAESQPQAATTTHASTARLVCPPIKGLDFSKSDETWLFVFSTTCSNCKGIMPIWNRLYAENKLKSQAALRMIGVVIKGEPAGDFRTEHSIEFPIHLPEDTMQFLRTLNIEGLPHAVLVDRRGHVIEQLW